MTTFCPEWLGKRLKLGQRLAERRRRLAVCSRRKRGGSGRLPVRLGALRVAGPAPVKAERRWPGLPGLRFGFEEGRYCGVQPATVLERQEMIDRLLRQGVVEPIARIGVATLNGEHSEFDELVEPPPQRHGMGRPVVECSRAAAARRRNVVPMTLEKPSVRPGDRPATDRLGDDGPLDRVGKARREGFSGQPPCGARSRHALVSQRQRQLPCE